MSHWCEMIGRIAIRFNFYAKSRRWKISTSTLARRLRLLKHWTLRTVRRGTRVHIENHFYLCSCLYCARDTAADTASRGRCCILPVPGSIDFPRVSSRYSRLNEVTDFQWLAAAWMTGARSLSEFYIKLEFKRHQTCDCARNSRLLSSSRKERRITCKSTLSSLKLKSLRHNELIQHKQAILYVL